MPMYYFTCDSCATTQGLRLKAGEQKTPHACRDCGSMMRRDPRPPSSQVMESIDNGLMPRRVERLADAERLYKDRAANDPNLKPL